MCGPFVLDKHLWLRYIGAPLAPLVPLVPLVLRREVVVTVQVRDMAEADSLRAMAGGVVETALVVWHCASLARAVVHELGHQMSALRALPLVKSADQHPGTDSNSI